MNNLLLALKRAGVIPVIVIDDASKAFELGKALVECGLPYAEVTFRTVAAKEAIKILSSSFPEIVVGAGTVLSVKQVDEALEAGAKFIVSPCFDEEVVDYCINKDVLVFPGCVTPSEVNQAIKRGLDIVKFFPAENYGGLKTITSISAPFGNVSFIPTGGIKADNLANYLSSSKVFACGGTWIATKQLIADNDFAQIRKNIQETVAIVNSIRGDVHEH